MMPEDDKPRIKEERLIRVFSWCLVLTLVIVSSLYPIALRGLAYLAGPALLAIGHIGGERLELVEPHIDEKDLRLHLTRQDSGRA